MAESTNSPDATGMKVLASFAVVMVAVALVTVSSLALFTDQESITGNVVGTGTLDLVATPATAVITAADLVPGAQVTSPLDVANTGSLELRYSATSTTDEDVLAPVLVMTVKAGVTTCDDAGWSVDGTVLYSGPFGSTAVSAVFGDATQGAQAGDRTLAAGGSETLCVNVALPTSATSAVAGLTSTATFTFDAEQTANNP